MLIGLNILSYIVTLAPRPTPIPPNPSLVLLMVNVHISVSGCDVGYGFDGDRCVLCPVGSYSNSETNMCEQCSPGSTTTRVGQHQCGMYLIKVL